ncbi:hypothetical protein TSOC_011873 [Tetrabaena socialis]|uniref:F-box domain-containing protein n=1 Tax=Tetrabaena socialis TaxID=47790 RepID=A0A2J7ZPJ7_9CHLO|nr:hypothetical protein TSOC_011873 [Tetrabaena socialis]|eukprot:PNH02172.1 hypothetical protein TSOC_011873 [Tetrabaena socialis]
MLLAGGGSGAIAPREIIQLIGSHLALEDLASARLACRYWRRHITTAAAAAATAAAATPRRTGRLLRLLLQRPAQPRGVRAAEHHQHALAGGPVAAAAGRHPAEHPEEVDVSSLAPLDLAALAGLTGLQVLSLMRRGEAEGGEGEGEGAGDADAAAQAHGDAAHIPGGAAAPDDAEEEEADPMEVDDPGIEAGWLGDWDGEEEDAAAAAAALADWGDVQAGGGGGALGPAVLHALGGGIGGAGPLGGGGWGAQNFASAYMSELDSRSRTVVDKLLAMQSADDSNALLLSALAGLLRGAVASATEAADYLGLTTAMLVEGLGLGEDTWFFDAYKQCLVTRAGDGLRHSFNMNQAKQAAQAADIAAGRYVAPPPPPPAAYGYTLRAATQVAKAGRSLLAALWPSGPDAGSEGGARARDRRLQQGQPPPPAASPASSADGATARLQFGGYELEVAAGKPPAGLSVQYDSRGIPERTRIVGARGNRVVGGLLLQQVRHPLSEVLVGTHSDTCSSKFAKLRAECVRIKYRTTGSASYASVPPRESDEPAHRAGAGVESAKRAELGICQQQQPLQRGNLPLLLLADAQLRATPHTDAAIHPSSPTSSPKRAFSASLSMKYMAHAIWRLRWSELSQSRS